MSDTLSKWRVATLLAAVTLFTVGCDSRHDAGAAQQLRIAATGIAAKSGEDDAVGTDQAVEDSSLTVTVRAAIFADPKLQSQHIKVVTEDAAVTLRGHVDSPALRDRAIEIASSVDGVTQVQDRLKVRG
jgi:hyperosmotically inducible protein